MGAAARKQPVLPDFQSLMVNPRRSAHRYSRAGIPYLRRISRSPIESVSNRFPHFAIVASSVTPYRGFGFGVSIACRITRAQSSAVVFDFARVAFAQLHALA